MIDKLINLIQSVASGIAQRWKEFFDNPDREDCENCAHNGKQGAPCNECFIYSKWEKIMTNADKIRAMTDEELAKLIDSCYGMYSCDFCPNGKNILDRELCKGELCHRKTGADVILEWLKLPVREET